MIGEAALPARIEAMTVPLHFGTFGGTLAKLLYVAGGLTPGAAGPTLAAPRSYEKKGTRVGSPGIVAIRRAVGGFLCAPCRRRGGAARLPDGQVPGGALHGGPAPSRLQVTRRQVWTV